MPTAHIIPLILISILIGLLFGLIAWGFWRARSRELKRVLLSSRDEFLLGLLILAAFAMGVFLTYVLLSLEFY
jgi:hypothetical protein